MTAAALLAFALLAVGCSTLRLAYGQGPTLTYWWLDRYVGFAPDQAPRVRAALAQWFTRHRRDDLAEDVALLDQAALEIRKDLSPAQACTWWGRYEKRRDLYLGQLAPALAEIAPMLAPSQWQHIQAHFDQTNDDWRDDNLDPAPHRRERAAVERVIDRAESLYGRLDRAQREFVAERMRRSAWEPQRWFDERLVDQRDTLQTLRELARPGSEPAAQLDTARAMLVRVVQPSSETMRQYRARLLDDQCAFAAELHNRSHPAQRQKASDKLSGWAQDLRGFLPATALSAAQAPAGP